MLILTRNIGQSLIIPLPSGETIRIVALGIKGNQMRIGVEAPRHIAVDRQEIHDRKQQGPSEAKAVANG